MGTAMEETDGSRWTWNNTPVISIHRSPWNGHTGNDSPTGEVYVYRVGKKAAGLSALHGLLRCARTRSKQEQDKKLMRECPECH